MIKTKAILNNQFILLTIVLAAASTIIFSYQYNKARQVPVFYNESVYVTSNIQASTAGTLVAEPAKPAVPNVPVPLIPPRVIERILPQYPFSALSKGIEGSVVLSVYVSASGLPVKVEKKTSSGYEVLDDAAIKSVLLWKFVPAKRGVQSISSWFEIPVVFRIK